MDMGHEPAWYKGHSFLASDLFVPTHSNNMETFTSSSAYVPIVEKTPLTCVGRGVVVQSNFVSETKR